MKNKTSKYNVLVDSQFFDVLTAYSNSIFQNPCAQLYYGREVFQIIDRLRIKKEK